MKAILPSPPTYPARPMNGGRLEKAEPLNGDWRYRPKFNGRRVLLHLPTMRTWNRELEEVGYMHPAFKKLQSIAQHWPETHWYDLEFLWGRTSVGKGAIIVLDYVEEEVEWGFRQQALEQIFKGHELSDLDIPGKEQVFWSAPLREGQEQAAWKHMQEINSETMTTFFEGLVAYDVKADYPTQLFSPLKETRHWMKYRFIT